MERRDFLRRIATVGMAAVAIPSGVLAAARKQSKPIVRLPVDSDLSASSLRWAESFAGFVEPPDTYGLRVHPLEAPLAERVLRAEFGETWRAHLIIDDQLTDSDEWYLEGSKAIVYSAGG